MKDKMKSKMRKIVYSAIMILLISVVFFAMQESEEVVKENEPKLLDSQTQNLDENVNENTQNENSESKEDEIIFL